MTSNAMALLPCSMRHVFGGIAGESADIGVSDRIVLAAADRNCFLEVCAETFASSAGTIKRCCHSMRYQCICVWAASKHTTFAQAPIC